MSLPVVELGSPLHLLVTRDAVTVTSSESLRRAGQLMREHNVSALLVDDGQAIISERDITRAVAAGLGGDDAVATVAVSRPVTVNAEMSIIDAAALMLNEEIRHLVVRLTAQRTGIVSLRAVLAVLLQAAKPEIWLEHLRLQVKLVASDLWLGG